MYIYKKNNIQWALSLLICKIKENLQIALFWLECFGRLKR